MDQLRQIAICVHIRWMIRRDMAEVLRIEHDSFEFNWTEEDFLICFRQRNCLGLVAEHENRVIGFMVYQFCKTKLCILNFAVAPAWRRCAVGAQMAEKLIKKLSQQRRQQIVLEVRETNLAAQHFFHAQGFRASRVIRKHYCDSAEDAYLMQYQLPADHQAEPLAAPANRIANYL